MTSDTGRKQVLALVLGACLLCPVSSSWAADYPIAGVAPDRRPAGAPVVTAVEKGKDWYSIALTGVELPYPASLRFLEDQGNWFTPFSHPGMTGRFDIRDWHH